MKPAAIQHSNTIRLSRHVLVVFVVLVLFAIGLLAVVPPVSRDALTHHLYVPKLYIKAGGIVELPHIPFSYYPMNLDLLYTIPLIFGYDIIPKYIHFLFALITAWLLYRYLDKRMGKVYGLFGVFFFLSIPIVIKLSSTVYVDLGLICFTTASVLALEEWREQGFPIAMLVVAGIFCGLALGTKYNGLVTFALLALMVPIIYLRGGTQTSPRQFRAIYHGAIFAGVALLVFSPWIIRNIVWTGNPVFPLYQGVFEKEGETSDAESASSEGDDKLNPADRIRWTPFNLRSIIYGESNWEIATIPIRIFFQGQDDNPKYFDGVLSPWLLLFPMGLLLKRRNGGQILPGTNGFLLAFAGLFLIIVFLKQDMRIRWISPIIPPLVLLSAVGLNRIASAIGAMWSRIDPFKDALVLGVAICCILSTSIPYVHDSFQKVVPLEYLSGKISRQDYISRYRPEFSVIKYANQHLEKSEKILGVYLGNRGYYFDNPVVFSNRFIEDYVKPFRNAEGIGEKIQSNGIRYLLVNLAFLNRRASESLDTEHQEMLGSFFSNELHPIFESKGHGLYRLN